MKKINLNYFFGCLYFFLIPTKAFFGSLANIVFWGISFINAFLILKYFIKNKLLITFFDISFLIFLLFFAIRAIPSPSGKVTYAMAILMLIHIIGATSAIKNIYFSKNQNIDDTLTTISKKFILGTVMICIYCILKEGFSSRLGSIVFLNNGTYIELSYCIAISLYFIIYKYIFKKERFDFIVLMTLLFFSFLSGTRKVLIGTFIFTIILLLFKNNKNIFKIIKFFIISSLILLVSFFVMFKVDFIYEKIGYRFESLISYQNGEIIDYSAEERKNMRVFAMQLFNDHKIIGVGADGFKYYYYLRTSKNLYSHCNYTEILCDLGIIGFILYYIFYLVSFIKCFNIHSILKKNIFADKNFQILFFVLGCLLCNLILDYGTVSYYQEEFIMLNSLISLIIFSLNKEVKNENRN